MASDLVVNSPCNSCPFRKDVRYVPFKWALTLIRYVIRGERHDCHSTKSWRRKTCAGYLLAAEKWRLPLPMFPGKTCAELGVKLKGTEIYESPDDLLLNGVVRKPEEMIVPKDSRWQSLSVLEKGQRYMDMLTKNAEEDERRCGLVEFKYE